jgi:SAM-dependent methyltransferase
MFDRSRTWISLEHFIYENREALVKTNVIYFGACIEHNGVVRFHEKHIVLISRSTVPWSNANPLDFQTDFRPKHFIFYAGLQRYQLPVMTTTTDSVDWSSKVDRTFIRQASMFHSCHAFLLHCLLSLFIRNGTDGYHVSLSTEPPLRTTVQGIPVHRVPLQYHTPTSPYALSVTATDAATVPSTAARSYNFLATQVWPSARTAARALVEWFPSIALSEGPGTLCEFGCGPGLPSLTTALLGATQVYATDVDDLALALVRQAAREQGVSDRVTTGVFDLTDTEAVVERLPLADLYLFSDVFENAAVAEGAAHITAHILNHQHCCVWVFAQTDRSQREIYLRELRRLLNDPTLTWSPSRTPTTSGSWNEKGDSLPKPWKDRLWLCDIDETNVFYG